MLAFPSSSVFYGCFFDAFRHTYLLLYLSYIQRPSHYPLQAAPQIAGDPLGGDTHPLVLHTCATLRGQSLHLGVKVPARQVPVVGAVRIVSQSGLFQFSLAFETLVLKTLAARIFFIENRNLLFGKQSLHSNWLHV